MYRIMTDGVKEPVGIEIDGRLTRGDYRKLASYVEGQVEKRNPLRVFVDVEKMTAVEPGAVWEDLKFGVHHARDIERMTFVGRQRWLGVVSVIMRTAFRTPCRVFGPGRGWQAWQWLIN